MQGEFSRNGLRWHLDLNEGIDFAIYLFGAFEPELVRYYTRMIPPGSIVLDLGANVGAHTVPLARQVGSNGRVVAVEATSYAFGKLTRNLSLNPGLTAQVTPVHGMLLADDEGSEMPDSLHSSWPLTSGGDVHPTLGGALKPLGEARKLMLDKLVTELALPRVDWVKLDVDGNEHTVLQGGRETLSRFQPHILMELAPYCFAQSPGGFAAMVELLTARGYRFFDPTTGKAFPTAAAELEAQIPANGSINVLASARGMETRSRG